MTCDKCGGTIEIGGWPFCPDHSPGTASVVGDEIDITVEHFGPTPERFRSRERMKQRMKSLNLEPFVRHVGSPGSDKSKHTQRFV